VRLVIDDTYATATITTPLALGWVTPPADLTVEMVPGLVAEQIRPGDAALAPAATLLALQRSHGVVPEVAVAADAAGAVAMRTPVRPDEIEATPVRLLDVSGTAELLARATLYPFYGINPTGWVRDGDAPGAARAAVVIVEGAEALREPEGGYSEDLARAWFILTAQPFVSHLLLIPRDLPVDERERLLACLERVKAEGLARRREWRPALAEREGVARERANAFWAAQRLDLEERDREALLALLHLGSRRTSNPPPSDVTFIARGGA
jgi:predicted solute-binding protein